MPGYQIIEPDFLAELIRQEIPVEIIISILSWVVDCLRREEELSKLPIEIEVVKAEYMGAYPCIGIHYLVESEGDWELEVTAKADSCFQKGYLSTYYSYFSGNSFEVQQNIDKFHS